MIIFLKKDMIDILCCPTCKADLDLKIEKEKDDEIVKGLFTCKKCKKTYPIYDGIPNLLPK